MESLLLIRGLRLANFRTAMQWSTFMLLRNEKQMREFHLLIPEWVASLTGVVGAGLGAVTSDWQTHLRVSDSCHYQHSAGASIPNRVSNKVTQCFFLYNLIGSVVIG
jgi:hypothetical protein